MPDPRSIPELVYDVQLHIGGYPPSLAELQQRCEAAEAELTRLRRVEEEYEEWADRCPARAHQGNLDGWYRQRPDASNVARERADV